MNARRNLLGVLGAVCLLSGTACQEQMPADAYSADTDPAPDGAEMIDQKTYQAYVDSGNWFVVTKRTAAELEMEQQQTDANDLATVLAYEQEHPELGDIIPPDPPENDDTVVPRDDGNFDHMVSLPGGKTLTVVTYGRRWWIHLIANGIRVFPTRDNQLNLYRGFYDVIPEDVRNRMGFKPPDEVAADASMTAEAILALNKAITDPSTSTGIINGLKPNQDIVLPPAFLSDCESEIGYGTGNDLTDSKFDGTCDFGAGGIVKNYNWALRPYLTCVKSQANRGTCTGFACTAAIEILVNKIHGDRVNLSEQAFYNRARTMWDTPYGTIDGLMGDLALQGMAADGWLLYFENQWNYNPSSSRVMNCVQTDASGNCTNATYTDSCVDYMESCSDTVHQTPFACYDNGTYFFCGYALPVKNPNNYGYRMGSSSVFWDQTDPVTSLAAMRLCLAAGYPVLLGHPVTTAWDCAEISTCSDPNDDCTCPVGRVDGYMQYVHNDKVRGGHGTCAVGFIDNDDLAEILPDAPPGDGGGYIIVKNSWGNCWGDGGFLYIPYSSIMEYTKDAMVVISVL